ncbi:MAG: molybdopterin synthase catalytic subunit MoaE [Thiobacillus sp.]|nr:molybdopterin synthase catalytic subunit MoaE [Thiobacillus sp.]
MKIQVQTAPFDLAAEVAALYRGNPKVGAVASFLGLVRDSHPNHTPAGREGDGVNTLTLEHYPGMTEKSLEQIARDALARWDLIDVTVIHRVGELRPTEPIVLVAVASSHRGEAFAACEFIMDYLKTRAPFWKKEVTAEGERWVEARESDELAATKWAR